MAALMMSQSVVGMASSSSMAFRSATLPESRRSVVARRGNQVVGVRAEVDSQVILNPSIQKDSDKVVNTVVASELTKPLTAYCRCWRSGTFPLCDGSHAKHNKATGDNVGPLLLKK